MTYFRAFILLISRQWTGNVIYKIRIKYLLPSHVSITLVDSIEMYTIIAFTARIIGTSQCGAGILHNPIIIMVFICPGNRVSQDGGAYCSWPDIQTYNSIVPTLFGIHSSHWRVGGGAGTPGFSLSLDFPTPSYTHTSWNCSWWAFDFLIFFLVPKDTCYCKNILSRSPRLPR